ncbi:MAG TPA: hypothetical protein VF157_05875, partial [Chloroflexota bacterium]
AAEYLDRSVALMEPLGNLGTRVQIRRADLALLLGDSAGAATRYRQGLQAAGRLGRLETIAGNLSGLALIAAGRKDPERAVTLLGAAESLRESIGAARLPARGIRLEPYIPVIACPAWRPRVPARLGRRR